MAGFVTESTRRLGFTDRYGRLAPGCLQFRQYVLGEVVLRCLPDQMAKLVAS